MFKNLQYLLKAVNILYYFYLSLVTFYYSHADIAKNVDVAFLEVLMCS